LTRFYLALLLSFDNYVVLLSMRPLWRENGSVIYYTIASGPCQSNHTWAEVPQNSRPYLTVSSETPPTWRARFPYVYPPGTGWPSYTPGHWVPFLSPLTTRRDYGGSIPTRLHTQLILPLVLHIYNFQACQTENTASLTVASILYRGVVFIEPMTSIRCMY
jgi:hypothetical protein